MLLEAGLQLGLETCLDLRVPRFPEEGKKGLR